MNTHEAVNILEEHNRWRRSESEEMICPQKVGEAIDVLCNYFKKINEKKETEFIIHLN